MDSILYIIGTIAVFVFLYKASKNSIQDQISRRLEEDEKARKEAKDLEQQLRDEDKYDNDYRKRHS